MALAAAGIAASPPRRVRALIDTGASCTCVEPAVLEILGLSPTGSVSVNTPTTGDTAATKDQYDISLTIPGGSPHAQPLTISVMAVIGSELFAAQGIHALIGRDVLEGCLFSYDGQAELFTLAY